MLFRNRLREGGGRKRKGEREGKRRFSSGDLVLDAQVRRIHQSKVNAFPIGNLIRILDQANEPMVVLQKYMCAHM